MAMALHRKRGSTDYKYVGNWENDQLTRGTLTDNKEMWKLEDGTFHSINRYHSDNNPAFRNNCSMAQAEGLTLPFESESAVRVELLETFPMTGTPKR